MARQHLFHDSDMPADERAGVFQGIKRRTHLNSLVWLTFKEAAVWVGSKSMKGFYEWRKRHGVVAVNGRVTRRDLDRALTAAEPIALDYPTAMHASYIHSGQRLVVEEA